MADEDIKKIAEDATTYPILTENVSYPAAQGRSGLSAGTAPLSQKVDLTLREILGWRPRNNDPKGFLASLTQSFEIKDFEGHTQWTWRPRTYAAEADLGAITGAQASLYSRARAALDQALPLLDGLTPLRSDHDQEDIDSARAIVHSSLTELVYELSIEGGPRLGRVDGYFHNLLGQDFTHLPTDQEPNPRILDNPEKVDGQLGALLHVLGLTGEKVNTVEEEQNLTNFFILVDTVNSLWLTWRTQRTAFMRGGQRSFLGTQLVLLSRNLSVVAESVEETYFTMDSVFLGPAERQVTPIHLKNGSTIYVAELLDWIYRFATEEGPRLLREGGKDGVLNAFRPTLDRLTELVEQAVGFSINGKDSKQGNPKGSIHTARVQRALEELKANLVRTQENAGEVLRFPTPQINAIYQIPIEDNQILLIVNGHNFRQGANVRLSTTSKGKSEIPPIKISHNNITVVSSRELKVLLDKDILSKLNNDRVPGASINVRTTVENRDGQEKDADFTLVSTSGKTSDPGEDAKLVIDNIAPRSISLRELKEIKQLSVIATGQHIRPNAQLKLKIENHYVEPMTKIANVIAPIAINAIFDLESQIGKIEKVKSIQVVVINSEKESTEKELSVHK